MTLKGYSIFSRTPGLELCQQFNFVSRPLIGGEGDFIPLQRCSQCILQPQPNGLTCTYNSKLFRLLIVFILSLQCQSILFIEKVMISFFQTIFNRILKEKKNGIKWSDQPTLLNTVDSISYLPDYMLIFSFLSKEIHPLLK